MPLRHSPPAVAEQASASTHEAELQRLLLAGPPADFDFRAEVSACSRQWVEENAPQLIDLVNDGTLVVVPRRPDYLERRSDGYVEPRVVVLVGTAHVSRRSQRDVDRVIRAVLPDSVVVELCKSRSAVLAATSITTGTTELEPLPLPPGDGNAAPQPAAGTEPRVSRSRAPVAATTATAAAATTSSYGCRFGSGSDPESDYGPGAEQQDACSDLGSSDPAAGARGGPPGPLYINPMNLGGGDGGDVGGGDGGGSGFLSAVARSVSLGGQSALLLRVLLAGVARRTAGALGVAGGGEFAAAQVAADAVGCQVVLGDRPVEITLSRAWAALPLRRRVALCRELLRGALGAPRQALSEELVERLKSDDAVGAFFNQLSNSYPELVSPLVTERDLYLAWSLKRSKAVNGAGVVVGVVGRGHLRGVVHALLRDQGGAGLRFTDLVDGRNNRKRRREQAVQRLVVELAIGAAAYSAWLAWQKL